jgi:GTP-binding protein
MFIDEAKIYVRSGKGGDGMVHFLQQKFITHGGPDGGDGGKGGNIIFVVNNHMNTLQLFQHKTHFIADDGKKGGSNNQTGHGGQDLTIEIPAGTLIYDFDSGEILGDLVEKGQQLILCNGGRGGKGNPHYKNSRNQAPRTAEKGEPGEEKNLRLELKLIADVGIVGMPNAGKSSLLAAVTNARPKIANYPFTTLEPNLGVVNLDDKTSLVLADIPGLVEGAHMGVGLGDSFLRHIQRCRVLIHLLNGESDDPLADFAQINSELALFDPQLGEKPQIVVLNKMDNPEVEQKLAGLQKKFKKRGYQLLDISALARTNLTDLMWKAAQLLRETPEPEKPVATGIPVYRPEEDARDFTISKDDDGNWRVKGKAIERAAAMTYWEMEESIRRFQRLMETLGVDDALRKAGVENGETVCIGNFELEWQE